MARLLPAGLAFFICFSISRRTALLQHCFPWLPCYRGAVLLASVLPQSNPPGLLGPAYFYMALHRQYLCGVERAQERPVEISLLSFQTCFLEIMV